MRDSADLMFKWFEYLDQNTCGQDTGKKFETGGWVIEFHSINIQATNEGFPVSVFGIAKTSTETGQKNYCILSLIQRNLELLCILKDIQTGLTSELVFNLVASEYTNVKNLTRGRSRLKQKSVLFEWLLRFVLQWRRALELRYTPTNEKEALVKSFRVKGFDSNP